jgi:hypothetical protein
MFLRGGMDEKLGEEMKDTFDPWRPWLVEAFLAATPAFS